MISWRTGVTGTGKAHPAPLDIRGKRKSPDDRRGEVTTHSDLLVVGCETGRPATRSAGIDTSRQETGAGNDDQDC